MVGFILSVLLWLVLAAVAFAGLSRLRAGNPSELVRDWGGVVAVLGTALLAGLIYSLVAQFAFGKAMEDYCRSQVPIEALEPVASDDATDWFTGPANCYRAAGDQVLAYRQTSFALLRFMVEVVGPIALASAIVAYGFRSAAPEELYSLRLDPR